MPAKARVIRVIALLVTLGSEPARASPPPGPDPHQVESRFLDRLHEAIAPCDRRARAAGAFGDVFFRRLDRRRFELRWSRALGPTLGACAEAAIQDLVAREGEIPEMRFWTVVDLSLGQAVPLLPEPRRLLPVLRAYQRATPEEALTLHRTLADLLGPDLAQRGPDCAEAEGSNVASGLWQWVKRWGTDVVLPVPALFGREGFAWLVDDVVFTMGNRQQLCWLVLDRSTRAALQARLDALGSCWADELPRVLVTGRVAFPAGRRYRRVSTAHERGCAIAEDGRLLCCGRAGPAPPGGTAWQELALAGDHGCALDARGAVACWGDDKNGQSSPPAGPFTAVGVSPGRSCGLRPDGSIACWGYAFERPLPAGAGYRRLSLDEAWLCAVHASGALACASARHGWTTELTPPEGALLAADSRGACVLRRDGAVLCPSFGRFDNWGLVAEGPFVEIAALDSFGCGRARDGRVSCWGQTVGMRPPPATTFTQITSGPGRLCGVRGDGGISCWGSAQDAFRER